MGSVDHCWTTPSVCTNGDVDTPSPPHTTTNHHPHPTPPPAKALITIRDCGTGFILKYGSNHLSCLPSSQHYLQGLHKVSNSLVKSACEVSDAVCFKPLTNKLHLWYRLSLKYISCDNILQFVTDVVQRMGVFGKLIQYAMPILYSIPSPCTTPPCVLSHCPHYHPVAFQGRCAQVFQIYSNRKLTDPHIQQKIWPISIHHCQYI